MGVYVEISRGSGRGEDMRNRIVVVLVFVMKSKEGSFLATGLVYGFS